MSERAGTQVLLSVECWLPDMDESSPAEAVTAVVLAALRESSIEVAKVIVEENRA
jgi:hypothetical protein